MKNIFKLMGIALMSCSLMVACGDKDNDSSPDNPNPNPNPNPGTSTAKVTFGGDSFDAASGIIATNNGFCTLRLFQTANQLPYVEMSSTTTTGNYTANQRIQENTEQGYTYPAGSDSQELPDVNVAWDQQIQRQTSDGQTYYTGDWKFLTANLALTAFDLNTLTLSFNLTATLFDFAGWNNDDFTNVEDGPTKNLTVNVSNFTFTAASSK